MLLIAVLAMAGCGDSQVATPTSPTGVPPATSGLTLTCNVGTTDCSSAMLGQTVTFTAERGTLGDIRSAMLDFGDGGTADLGALPVTIRISHVYAQVGTYTARLTASRASGETPVVTAPVNVGTLVTVSMGAVDLGGLNVLATADVQGAAVALYEWKFEGTVPNVTTTIGQVRYAYQAPGFKDLSVRILLSDGRVVNVSTSVIVE